MRTWLDDMANLSSKGVFRESSVICVISMGAPSTGGEGVA
jgi:hypothetical protein